MKKAKWFIEIGMETISGEFEVNGDEKPWEIEKQIFDEATSYGQLGYGWEIEDCEDDDHDK